MKFEFVPEMCKGEGAAYTGSIVLDVPKSTERQRYIRKAGILAVLEKAQQKVKTGEEKTIETVSFDLADEYDAMTAMSEFVEKHILEVNIKRNEDGYVITKEWFLCSAACGAAMRELVMLFVKGFEPTKNSAT